MSRFLFTLLPSNDLGVITRALPVAKSLREKGHTIVFSVCSKVPSKLLNEENFVNIPIRTPIDNYYFELKKLKNNNDSLPVKFLKNIKLLQRTIVTMLKALPIKFVKPTAKVIDMEHFFIINGILNKNFIFYKVESYMRVINKVDADFVIDFWNPYAVIAAKVLNLPLITINQFDVHPASNGFIWWQEKKSKVKSALPIVNSVLRQYHLKEVNKFEELTVGDLTLTLGMPGKEEENNSYINHIGFLVYQKEESTLPKAIKELDNTKPLVWVYSGNPRYSGIKTDFDSEILIDICVKILAKEDINIVLTTGYHSISSKYYPLPKNIYFSEFVDGILMAERADIVIHHGGYGSCQTALLTGTPSLIIPTFSERESNARRIAKLGVGEFVLPIKKKYSKSKVVNKNEFINKFHQVLNDEKYKRKANEIKNELKVFNQKNNAIKQIEKFIYEYNKRSENQQHKKLRFIKSYSKNLKVIKNKNEKYPILISQY